MKKLYTDYLLRLKDRTKKPFDAMQDALGISASTLCRYFKGESEPTVDTLERIVEYLGGSMRDLYAQVGEQELKASEQHDYMGTDAMADEFARREKLIREHCDQRIAHADELRRQLQQSFDTTIAAMERTHATELQKLDAHFDRSNTYLSGQIVELRGELSQALSRALRAEAERDVLAASRRRLLWCTVTAIVFVLSVFVGLILADHPHLITNW